MNTAKPVTTVRVCVSTFLSVTPLDVFLEGPLCFNFCTHDTAGCFDGEFTSIPAVFMVTTCFIFLSESCDISKLVF